VDTLNAFDIAFKGLKDGDHSFQYDIDRHFFEAIEHSLIEDGDIKAKVLLKKQPSMLTLTIDVSGTVFTQCDRCLEPLNIEIKNSGRMFVKFGDSYDEPSEEIIVLPHEEHILNVAQFIYEYIGLSIPVQKVHNGKSQPCNQEMLSVLNKLKGNRDKNEEETDPRWNELKKLIDKNK